MPLPDPIPTDRLRPPSLREELLATLATIPPLATDTLFSITVETSWLHPSHLSPPPGSGHYWARPEEEHYLLGVGRCVTLETAGEERFTPLRQTFDRLCSDWHRCGDDGPALFLGAAFDGEDPMTGQWQGWPNTSLTIPQLLFRVRGGRRTITFTARGAERAAPEHLVTKWLQRLDAVIGREPVDDGASPMGLQREDDRDERRGWDRRVAAALAGIAGGALEKVVIARRARVRGERPFDAGRLLALLGCLYPGCVLFAARAADTTLIAATPERLLTLEAGRVWSDALAGTIRRAADPAEDRRLAERLLADPKSRHEHELVRRSVAAALRRHCSAVNSPARPKLLRLPNLQHLHTPIEGHLRPDVSPLDLIADLHPTPAVGGSPAEAATRWLRGHGDPGRGWYSGVVGWLSPEGDGELSVLLRCALLDGDRAHLFAGSGIVADSDPAAEWAESELKLAALLRALEHG
ncbi:isochorismate synthase [Endothiovibrio diazotrophicus]